MSITTPVVVPARTQLQRDEALEKANAVRYYRAALKRDIKAGVGGRDAMEVIAEPNGLEETWKVADLLLALPRTGPAKVSKILRWVDASPSKTVGGLSPRQRKRLLQALWALPSARRGSVAA